MSCPACGAAVRDGAAWCGQCFTRFDASEPAAQPAPQPLPPAAVPEYSRWRGGPLSMGPVGRISWTAGMVLVGLLALYSRMPFAIGVWWFVAIPLVLRSVWAKRRIT